MRQVRGGLSMWEGWVRGCVGTGRMVGWVASLDKEVVGTIGTRELLVIYSMGPALHIAHIGTESGSLSYVSYMQKSGSEHVRYVE